MLRVAVEKRGNVTLVRCQGRICFGESLKDLRDAVLCHNNSAVKIDLARVTRIDAAGLGVIAFLCGVTYAAGIDFAVVNPTRRVREVLEMVKLGGVVENVPPRFICIPRDHDEVSSELPRAVGWPF